MLCRHFSALTLACLTAVAWPLAAQASTRTSPPDK